MVDASPSMVLNESKNAISHRKVSAFPSKNPIKDRIFLVRLFTNHRMGKNAKGIEGWEEISGIMKFLE